MHIRILFFKKLINIEENEKKEEDDAPSTTEEEKKEEDDVPATEEEKEQAEEPLSKERLKSFFSTAGFFLDELEGIWRPIKSLIKRIRIVDTALFIQVSGDDPAEVGALTGWLNASIYAIYGRMQNFFRFKNTSINIIGDFLEKGWDYSFKTRISISLFQLLPLLFPVVKIYSKFKKFNEAQMKEEIK